MPETEANPIHEEQNLKISIINSAALPFLFILLLWIIKLLEIFSGESFSDFGIIPRTITGLKGILTSVFIHGDINHLLSNTFPFFILLTGLMFFYRSVALKVFILIWLMSGFWVWLFARYSSHIGASGVIYGMAAFLFLSGVLKKNRNLLAISMLTVFLYGGLAWGIFPVEERISWEAHLSGALAGFLCAVAFRKEGPVTEEKIWEDEDDDDPNAEWEITSVNSSNTGEVN
ncbi:MAG: rhomboid family intramembrane serine protease [Bacteroidia bacterium]|nr:rhomboid family intramembrane serine protease [Bacteroidia bacterium]